MNNWLCQTYVSNSVRNAFFSFSQRLAYSGRDEEDVHTSTSASFVLQVIRCRCLTGSRSSGRRIQQRSVHSRDGHWLHQLLLVDGIYLILIDTCTPLRPGCRERYNYTCTNRHSSTGIRCMRQVTFPLKISFAAGCIVPTSLSLILSIVIYRYFIPMMLKQKPLMQKLYINIISASVRHSY